MNDDEKEKIIELLKLKQGLLAVQLLRGFYESDNQVAKFIFDTEIKDLQHNNIGVTWYREDLNGRGFISVWSHSTENPHVNWHRPEEYNSYAKSFRLQCIQKWIELITNEI